MDFKIYEDKLKTFIRKSPRESGESWAIIYSEMLRFPPITFVALIYFKQK